MKTKLKNIIAQWQGELDELKGVLVMKGGEAASLEYNILATEALRLSICISDATRVLLQDAEEV